MTKRTKNGRASEIPSFYQRATRRTRLIREHQNIDRVPILGDYRRYKAEVELKKALPASMAPGLYFHRSNLPNISSTETWNGIESSLCAACFGTCPASALTRS